MRVPSLSPSPTPEPADAHTETVHRRMPDIVTYEQLDLAYPNALEQISSSASRIARAYERWRVPVQIIRSLRLDESHKIETRYVRHVGSSEVLISAEDVLRWTGSSPGMYRNHRTDFGAMEHIRKFLDTRQATGLPIDDECKVIHSRLSSFFSNAPFGDLTQWKQCVLTVKERYPEACSTK